MLLNVVKNDNFEICPTKESFKQFGGLKDKILKQGVNTNEKEKEVQIRNAINETVSLASRVHYKGPDKEFDSKADVNNTLEYVVSHLYVELLRKNKVIADEHGIAIDRLAVTVPVYFVQGSMNVHVFFKLLNSCKCMTDVSFGSTFRECYKIISLIVTKFGVSEREVIEKEFSEKFMNVLFNWCRTEKVQK
jgi:hypothetical protein